MSAYNDMPLVAHPLNERERSMLLLRLDDLLKFLGAPGDWGYESKLGVMTQQLHALRSEISKSVVSSEN